MWNDSVITNAGAALLEHWTANGTLTIDGATAGTGTVPAVALSDAVELVDERQTLSIVQSKSTEGGMQYNIQFPACDDGYICNQIGLWAHLDDGPRTLMAIYQDAQGVEIPSKAEMPDFVYAFYAVVQIGNTGTLQVTIDGNAYARVEQVIQTVSESETRIRKKLYPVYIQAEKPPEQSIWIQPIRPRERVMELLIETAPLTEDAAHRIMIQDKGELSVTNAVISEEELTNKTFLIV